MASPFPGMDPWLEDFWRDVHARLVIYAADQLQGRLPGDLRARVEERVVAEPLVLRVANEPVTETYIEIIDVGTGKRVVTVLKNLSLANKQPGDSRKQYRQKREELIAGEVSLVEIDLLRSGVWTVGAPEDLVPPAFRTTYRVIVRRGWRPDSVEIYRVPLRQRLPVIRVPLRQKDADAPLDLQALIDQCYRNGGYDDDLDYRRDPNRPLDPDDAPWADELLRSQGRR